MYKRRTLHNGRLRWFQSFFQLHVKQAYRIIPYDISRLVAINPCSISIKGNDSNSIIVSSNPLSQSVYYCPVNGRFLCEARLVNLPSFSSFTFQNRTLENSGNRLFYWPDVPTHGVKALKKTQGNYRYPKLAWTHPFFIHHWTSGKRVTAPLTAL